MEKEKKSKLELAMDSINKKYGSGSIIGSRDINEELEVVSTGSLLLDEILECGGYPIGKLIEYQGVNSGGKSSMCLHAAAEFQKKYPKRKAVLIDFEQSYDKKYAKSLGVDVENLLVAQPSCSEDGYNMIETLIRSGEVSLIILDSHTAAIPKAVVDAEVGQQTIALSARVNSVALGKIKPLLAPNRCTMIAVSQLRTNLGGYMAFGDSTGGAAYKFYSDIRIKVSRKADKVEQEDTTTVEVIKNKCGRPFGKCELTIIWGEGIDKVKEVIDTAMKLGLIVRGGAWYTIPGDVKLNGMLAVREFMKDNPEYFESLKLEVLEKGTI